MVIGADGGDMAVRWTQGAVHQHTGRQHMARAFLSSRAIGLSAAALILLTACASGGSGSASGSRSASTSGPASSSASASAPLSPQRALLAAATQANKVTSATEKLVIRDSGSQNLAISGRAQFQRTSTLEIAEKLAIATAGKRTVIKFVLTGKALYLNEASIASQIGKPWLKIDLSDLKTTPLASLAQLVQEVQSNNFLNLTQMFAATSNVRLVRHQTVDGVPTTEYAGSFQAAELSKALAPGLRKVLAPALKAMGDSTIDFRTWIDDQHHTRKVTEVETIGGLTINTTVKISGINQPVHITVPPASKTATPPGG
jgi:hypothetical protein